MTDEAFRKKGNRGPSKIGSVQADKELQELKELCDGALNGVYGAEGEAIAERVLDSGRSLYTEREVKRQLIAAGLVRR
jgi:hypothetical protein